MLWSLSDIVIIYVALEIAFLIREKNGRKNYIPLYFTLAVSNTGAFPHFHRDSGQFFILESVIFGLQFAVLIYTLFAEAKDTVTFLRKLIVDSNQ